MIDHVETDEAKRSKDAANAFWAALFSRNPDQIRRSVTPDVEWKAPPGNATAVALGVTHHMVGPDAIIKFVLEDFRRLFSNGMEIERISLTAEQNRVVFEQKQTAILVDGQKFDLDYVFIIETLNGKVARIREYMDTRSGHIMVFGSDHTSR
jgi:ketosteroid isomerase-like protein